MVKALSRDIEKVFQQIKNLDWHHRQFFSDYMLQEVIKQMCEDEVEERVVVASVKNYLTIYKRKTLQP